jgi:hypothetical protein
MLSTIFSAWVSVRSFSIDWGDGGAAQTPKDAQTSANVARWFLIANSLLLMTSLQIKRNEHNYSEQRDAAVPA